MGCFCLLVSEILTNLLSQKENIHFRVSGHVVTVLLSLMGRVPPHSQRRWLPANAGSLPASLASTWSKREGA